MITLTRTSSIMSWLEKALVLFGGNGYMAASLRENLDKKTLSPPSFSPWWQTPLAKYLARPN